MSDTGLILPVGVKSISRGVSVIHDYEGIGGFNKSLNKYFPYQGKADVKGVITIGRGHVLSTAEKASKVYEKGLTLAEVNALFIKDANPRLVRLSKLISPCDENQFNGAFSMFYNIEAAWNPGASPYKFHRAGNFVKAAESMLLYVMAGNIKYTGLWRRRMSEALLYISGEVITADTAAEEQHLQKRLSEYIRVVRPAKLQ